MASGVCLGIVVLTGALPAGATGAVAQTATDAVYASIAAALFERYVEGAIGATVRNAARARPEAEAVLIEETPRLRAFLGKHQVAFTAAMLPGLAQQVPAGDAEALAARLKAVPLVLDAVSGQRLIEADAEFRRNGQAVLRAMTVELDLVVARVLADRMQP